MTLFKHISVLSVIVLVFTSSEAKSFPLIPDINKNPGELCSVEDPHFKEFRYPEQIVYCRRQVSTATKNKICSQYGVNNRTNYTVDHIIPLSLGGSNNMENLWCQHRSIITNHLEFYYYQKVRDGEMRQVQAVHKLLTWKFNPEGKDHIPYPPSE